MKTNPLSAAWKRRRAVRMGLGAGSCWHRRLQMASLIGSSRLPEAMTLHTSQRFLPVLELYMCAWIEARSKLMVVGAPCR